MTYMAHDSSTDLKNYCGLLIFFLVITIGFILGLMRMINAPVCRILIRLFGPNMPAKPKQITAVISDYLLLPGVNME